jgi:hypothetical protein
MGPAFGRVLTHDRPPGHPEERERVHALSRHNASDPLSRPERIDAPASRPEVAITRFLGDARWRLLDYCITVGVHDPAPQTWLQQPSLELQSSPSIAQ